MVSDSSMNIDNNHYDEILYLDQVTHQLVAHLKKTQKFDIWKKSEAESAFIDIRTSISPNPLVKSAYLQEFNEAFQVAIDKDIPLYTGKTSQLNINDENMTTVHKQKRLLLSDGTPITKTYAKKKGAKSFVVFSTLFEQHATALEEYMITLFADAIFNISVNNGTSGTPYVSQVYKNGITVYRVVVTIYNGLEDMFEAGLIKICRLPRIIEKHPPLLPEQKKHNETFRKELRKDRKLLVQEEWITTYDLLTKKLNDDYSTQSYDSVINNYPQLKKWCFGQRYLLNTGKSCYKNKQALDSIGFLDYTHTDYGLLNIEVGASS
jgi:hypothetical protein